MPEICRFHGIVIHMYAREQLEPPHFHVAYGDQNAQIEIESFTVIHGALRGPQLKRVCLWAQVHQLELLENWKLCANKRSPNRIPRLP